MYRTHMDAVTAPDGRSHVCPHTQPGKIHFTDGSAMDIYTQKGTIHSTGAAFVTYNPTSTTGKYSAHLLKPSVPGVFHEN